MKNVLEYYYNLTIKDIHHKFKRYYFSSNGTNYAFVCCNDVLDEMYDIYELNIYLNYMGIYNHKIVLNREKNIITVVNNNSYILMSFSNGLDGIISLKDIEKLNNVKIGYFNKLKRNNWKELWTKKIDYFEYQMNQFGKKYPNIKKSINYFIGISENAISLLNDVIVDDNLVLSHRRLKKNSTYFDLYNPLNLILDNRVRDIADYLKNIIIYDKDANVNIIRYGLEQEFTENEWKLFFIRMLFPTFYYDKYENIVKMDKSDSGMEFIIYSIPKYEEIIKDLYNYLSLNFPMPDIEWLKKT